MQEDHIAYANMLYKKRYLIGPKICTCGRQQFSIYNDSHNKANKCSFYCTNYKCKKKFPITTNSFFQKFSYQNIKLISEIIKCFIIKDINATKAHTYINNELNILASEKLIRKVYTEIRKVICKYLKIEYQSGPLGNKDDGKYYSVDESLINHYQGQQVWLLGICDNVTKDFRLEASYNRDATTLKKFVTLYVEKGNNIVTDGWAGYAFLDLPDSGYLRIPHTHGAGDFGYGVQSTSHVESIWAQLKSRIKENYHIYPHGIFLMFVREMEYKIKTRFLSAEEKIKNFFDIFELSETVEDSALKFDHQPFLDENLNENMDSSDEEDN